jgi:tetratricopeptide (TPR) repeat protein
VVVLAGTLVVGGGLLPAVGIGDETDGNGTVGSETPATYAASADLDGEIDGLREHLAQQPKDAHSWAVLSLLLVEKGRITLDPAVYQESHDAAQRSLTTQPQDNDLAIAGKAALLSAQHRFERALSAANDALGINPFSAPALGVRVDALTELGHLHRARKAAHQFDEVQPGLPATTRLAYQAELRGDIDHARQLFVDSLSDATQPAARAFVEDHLGELARRVGRFDVSKSHYAAALDSLPDDPNALAGQARLLALDGHLTRAIAILRQVVSQTPLLEHLIALGELLELRGNENAAQDQYAVVRATARLIRAAGIRADLELAWFEADHGDPVKALRLARTEWHRRQPPMVADAMAWALHVNGKDQRALKFAHLATAYGGDARSLHHLGAIEAALGRDQAATAHLHQALRADRGYPPWQVLQVRQLLGELR